MLQRTGKFLLFWKIIRSGRRPLDGLPAHKLHCSVLAEEAIKAAVKDYYDKNGIEYDKAAFPDCESCGHCGG